jgi:hypothetical protein
MEADAPTMLPKAARRGWSGQRDGVAAAKQWARRHAQITKKKKKKR